MADTASMFQQVLDLLEEVSEPNSQGWRSALCVFHEDHDPSMQVNETGFLVTAALAPSMLRHPASATAITRPSCSPAPFFRSAKYAETDRLSVDLRQYMAGFCRS